jgi:hypothetical protein
MYIPRLGDRLTLTSDWTFLMHNERRNEYFFRIGKVKVYADFDEHGKAYSDVWEECQEKRHEIVKYHMFEKEPNVFIRVIELPPERTVEEDMRYRRDEKFISKEFLEETKANWSGNYRNMVYNVKYLKRQLAPDYKFTFPKGTILLVKRIYVRRGAPEFDSITFSAQNGPHKGKMFWVSLDDTRYLEFE